MADSDRSALDVPKGTALQVLKMTVEDRQLLFSSIDIHIAVVRRRINAEVNQSIKEILQRQLRELEALKGRI